MKIISWNVNGLRAVHKRGLFVPFVQKYKPDILCLQETKAEQGQAEVDLPEYEEYWNSAKRKGYSGTAIFTKQKPRSIVIGFPKEIVKKYDLAHDGHGDPNSEGRVITAEFEDFYLVNVYTPNSKPDLSRLELRYKFWDPAFLGYCKILEKKKPVVFCGDLNVAHTEIDLANPKSNYNKIAGYTQKEIDGFERLLKSGFVDCFRKLYPEKKGAYTYWSVMGDCRKRNIGWRIDYWIVSERFFKYVKDVKIFDQVLGSDHCPVEIEIKI